MDRFYDEHSARAVCRDKVLALALTTELFTKFANTESVIQKTKPDGSLTVLPMTEG